MSCQAAHPDCSSMPSLSPPAGSAPHLRGDHPAGLGHDDPDGRRPTRPCPTFPVRHPKKRRAVHPGTKAKNRMRLAPPPIKTGHPWSITAQQGSSKGAFAEQRAQGRFLRATVPAPSAPHRKLTLARPERARPGLKALHVNGQGPLVRRLSEGARSCARAEGLAMSALQAALQRPGPVTIAKDMPVSPPARTWAATLPETEDKVVKLEPARRARAKGAAAGWGARRDQPRTGGEAGASRARRAVSIARASAPVSSGWQRGP